MITEKQDRLKNIDGTRNYLTKEINQNELMNKKHKKSLWSFELLINCLF